MRYFKLDVRVAVSVLGTVVALFAVIPRSARPAEFCDDLDTEITHAATLRKHGDHRQAEVLYLKLLESIVARDCHLREARIWNGLGVIAIAEERPTDALRLFEHGKEMLGSATAEERAALRAKMDSLATTYEYNLAVVYLRLGWLNESRDSLRRVETFYRRHGATTPRKWASYFLQSSRVDRLQGHAGSARAGVREGLRWLGDPEPKVRAALWQERAWIEIDEGRLDAAEMALATALEASKDLGEKDRANVIADLAEVDMRRGRWAECRKEADDALELLRIAGAPDLNLEPHALFLKSVALWNLEDTEGARRASDRGLALMDSLRENLRDLTPEFFALRQRFYRHRLRLAVASEDPGSAWRVFESYRAQGLLNGSADKVAPEKGKKLEELRQKILESNWKLDTLDSSNPHALAGQKARLRLNAVTLRVAQARKVLAATRSSPPVEISPEKAIEMIDAGTLSLVFASGVEKTHVLTLDPRSGLGVVTLNRDRLQIEDLASKVVEGLDPVVSMEAGDRWDGDVIDLSQALLGPFAQQIDEHDRLLIVAEGPLERLPFEVLRHPRTGRYLIESHEVVYVPSFSVLGALRRRVRQCAPAPSLLFALGDPIYSSRDDRWPRNVDDPRNDDEALALVRLPATAEETQSIAKLYEPAATVVLGADATRERFLAEAPAHRVIHVASHARSDSEAPERSKIALSCSGTENRAGEACDLYVGDVANLKLCGQVVVLSACESAGGRLVEGEGIFGLPRAFLQAGASTVVASEWQVADKVTARLMTTFHRHLRDGEGPAAALRSAKLEQIEAGRPPSDWAAFILVGDWQIDLRSSSTFSSRSGPIHRPRSQTHNSNQGGRP